MFKLRFALCAAVFLGLMAGLMAGCTNNPNAPARISGQVTYKGNPLPAGTITFHSDGKGDCGSPINPDGTYEVRDVPTGELVVTVDTDYLSSTAQKQPDYGGKGNKMYAERVAAEGKAAASKAPPEQYVKIPSKYGNPKTSPLTATITAGRQVQNFTLID